jgi:hypothetical protein
MGVTQAISDLNSFSANIADFRHFYSPDDKKDSRFLGFGDSSKKLLLG